MARGSRSPVRSQMPRMSLSARGSAGTYDHNHCPPFTPPHDTGNGGIPLKFYDSAIGPARPAKTVSASLADASGGNNRERRGANNRRFPFGGR